MKSKMKIAIAFVAIALMLVVALVPMVSPISSDAAVGDVTVVPEASGSVTIKGTVKASSTVNLANALVKVTAAGVVEYALTDSSGQYEIKVYYTGAEKLDITVAVDTTDAGYRAFTGDVNATNPIAEFANKFTTYTYTGATGGVFANTDFVAGYVKITGALNYKGSYDLYEVNDVTVTAYYGATSATGKYKVATGQYSILVPANTTGITVKSTGFDDLGPFDVTTYDVTGKNLSNTTTYLMKITTSGAITGHTFTYAPGATSNVGSITQLPSSEGTTLKITYTLGVDPQKDSKFTVEDNKAYFKKVELNASNSGNITYDATFTGKLTMGTITSLTGNTVTAEFFDSEGSMSPQPSAENYTITCNTDGTYVFAFGKFNFATYDGVTKVKLTNTIGLLTATKEISFNEYSQSLTNQDISFNSTGYSLINGTVKMNGTSVSDVVLAKTGASATIGLDANNKTYTDSTGAFSFYAEDGKAITLTATGDFDTSAYSFTVSGPRTLNYVMVPKTLNINENVAVTDAGTKKLKDITVNYSIDDKATFSTVKTDKNGKFSISVRSDLTEANVYIYFTDASGVYTFAKGTADTAILMTDTTAANYKALQKEYTFNIKDADDNALVAADKGIGFTLAVYRVHAMTGTNAGLIYVQASADVASSISATATEGTYKFIGTTTNVGANPAAAGTYLNLYALGFTYSSNCLYSFEKELYTITATNLTFKTIEFENAITVKEAGDSIKAIKDVVVTVVDKDGKLVSSAVTTKADGTAKIVLPKVEAAQKYYYFLIDSNLCYTFGEDGIVDVYSGEAMITEIRANEKTYSVNSFKVKDSSGATIKAADITVTAYNVVGNKDVMSGLPVDIKEDGTFSIVMAPNTYKFVVVDNDGIYAFNDKYLIEWTEGVPSVDITAKNAGLTVTLKYYDGLAAGQKVMEGIVVDLYKVVSGEQTFVSTATTDSAGVAYLDINAGSTYVVKFTDPSEIFTFADVNVNAYTINVTPVEGLFYQELKFRVAGQQMSLADIDFDPDDYYMSGYKKDAITGEYSLISESEILYKNGKFYGVFPVNYANAQFVLNNIYFSVDQHINGVPDYYYTFAGQNGSPYVPANAQAVDSVENYTRYTTLNVDGIGPVAGVTAAFFDQFGNPLFLTESDENGKVIYDGATYAIDATKTVFGSYETPFGEVTFTAAGVAEQKIFLGKVTDVNGFGIDGAVVDYTVVYTNAGTSTIVEVGSVDVVDGYYYIFSEYIGANNYATTFVASALGYVPQTNEVGNFALVVGAAHTATAYIDFMDGHVTVAGDFVEAEEGSMVTVVAEKSYFVSDDLQTMQYTFVGWYVDGKQVTTENVYCFGLQDGMSIAPKYDAVPYEKPLPEPTPVDNSIDPTVLIIGICAVVIALIAVAYAVLASRQKKEQQ